MSEARTLQGKTALVTGSARGIGASIALELGKKGCNVVIGYTSESSKSKAESVAKEIEKTGSKAICVQANVADLAALDHLAQETLNFGNSKIDIIVNNAGKADNAPVGHIDLDHFESQYNVNVRAPLFLVQKLLPNIQPGGSIINISSVSARGGFAAQSVYGATKAAVEAMTRTWANEFGQQKQITVNAINPGPVSSDMVSL